MVVAIWGVSGGIRGVGGVRGVLGGFPELQKFLLVCFQGCWIQWQRFESFSTHHYWDNLQHFLKIHFCLESGFLLFLEFQKSLLVSFQGCWIQWQRFESSSIHHYWDNLQHFLKTHFCLESGFLLFLELQKSLRVCNCHQFATDHLHDYMHFTIYHLELHLQYSAAQANFCNISQNMHSKALVASQHKKTNKVVWTYKDDWHPWRTSTYERPANWEGNCLVAIVTFKFTPPPPPPCTPIWNCHWGQIMYWQIYVFIESPFETITVQVHTSSFVGLSFL